MAKKIKFYWLKRPKTVPKKRNLDQKVNDSKLHVWSLSSNFRFSSRKSQSQEKLAKASRILQYSFGVRKNICTVPFLGDQELHSRSTWKAIACVFLYITVRKFLFHRPRKFYLVRGRIISLRRFAVSTS